MFRELVDDVCQGTASRLECSEDQGAMRRSEISFRESEERNLLHLAHKLFIRHNIITGTFHL